MILKLRFGFQPLVLRHSSVFNRSIYVGYLMEFHLTTPSTSSALLKMAAWLIHKMTYNLQQASVPSLLIQRVSSSQACYDAPRRYLSERQLST